MIFKNKHLTQCSHRAFHLLLHLEPESLFQLRALVKCVFHPLHTSLWLVGVQASPTGLLGALVVPCRPCSLRMDDRCSFLSRGSRRSLPFTCGLLKQVSDSPFPCTSGALPSLLPGALRVVPVPVDRVSPVEACSAQSKPRNSLLGFSETLTLGVVGHCLSGKPF